jgi:hypothetical protein
MEEETHKRKLDEIGSIDLKDRNKKVYVKAEPIDDDDYVKAEEEDSILKYEPVDDLVKAGQDGFRREEAAISGGTGPAFSSVPRKEATKLVA